MSLNVDVKYVSLVGHYLQRFCKKNDYLWNCRCSICGDSSHNKTKARGYFYKKGTGINYICHNCNFSSSLCNFLKRVNVSLYNNYILESFEDSIVYSPTVSLGEGAQSQPEKDVEFPFDSCFFQLRIELPSIQSLPDDHIAKKYIVARKIPEKMYSSLYYTDDVRGFVEKFVPGKYNLPEKDARVVIPIYSEDKKLIGIQARALSHSQKGARYITARFDSEQDLVYNAENIDKNKTVYVTEGPFDSMHTQNCIAALGSVMGKVLKRTDICDMVVIYDNEPMSKEIVSNMRKVLKANRKLFIWPKNIRLKDINDCVLAGIDITEEFLKKNTYSDLQAEFMLENWKRV